MHIALIGNGPISGTDARLIDGLDLVVRFNKAKEFGITGKRCDALVIRDFTDALARNANAHAYRMAKELWLRFHPEHPVDRPYRVIGPPGWLRAEFDALKSKDAPMSSGLVTAGYVLTHFPDSAVHLFGFSHHGAPVHDWAAEKSLCDRLVKAGRLHRHASEDRPLAGLLVSWQRMTHRGRRFLHRHTLAM